MILRAAIAAFLGGALVATLTALVERSRIEYGNLALYGNGALAVLSVGAAIVLYLSWSSLLRRHAPIAALIAATVSLHLGIGLITPINAVLTGTFGAGALAGFLFSGLLFVVPTALLAALATRRPE